MSLLSKRIAQDGSERAPNRCLPRRASHTENWAGREDTRDFPLPVSMWLCGPGDKTFKTRTTPEGRAVSCATGFLQCVSLKNLETAVSRGFQSHWRSPLQVLLFFPSWPITTIYFFSQYFWPFPYLCFQEKSFKPLLYKPHWRAPQGALPPRPVSASQSFRRVQRRRPPEWIANPRASHCFRQRSRRETRRADSPGGPRPL